MHLPLSFSIGSFIFVLLAIMKDLTSSKYDSRAMTISLPLVVSIASLLLISVSYKSSLPTEAMTMYYVGVGLSLIVSLLSSPLNKFVIRNLCKKNPNEDIYMVCGKSSKDEADEFSDEMDALLKEAVKGELRDRQEKIKKKLARNPHNQKLQSELRELDEALGVVMAFPKAAENTTAIESPAIPAEVAVPHPQVTAPTIENKSVAQASNVEVSQGEREIMKEELKKELKAKLEAELMAEILAEMKDKSTEESE